MIALVALVFALFDSAADRRQQAARILEADILLFADDRAAVHLPWNDVLAFRLGLLRRGFATGNEGDWDQVVNPGALPGGGAPA